MAFQTKPLKIWHIFSDISGLGAYFLKPIFALRPWVRAGQFEYHEPYHFEPLFLFLTQLNIDDDENYDDEDEDDEDKDNNDYHPYCDDDGNDDQDHEVQRSSKMKTSLKMKTSPKVKIS